MDAEERHSFVSVLADAGVPVEAISQLVGHKGTSVTESVYRHQLRPVIQTDATVMNALFQVGGSRGLTGRQTGSPREAMSDTGIVPGQTWWAIQGSNL